MLSRELYSDTGILDPTAPAWSKTLLSIDIRGTRVVRLSPPSARHGAAALLVLSVLVQSCATSRVDVAARDLAELPSATGLLDALAERRHRLRGLRAIARLRYRSASGTESVRQVLAVERPDRIRIEILALMGTAFALTTSDGHMAAYVPSESKFYRGSASAANLAQYLPVEVSVATIVDHALATPPVYAGEPSAVDTDRGRIRLSQATADGQHVAWFRSDFTPVGYMRLDHHGGVMLDVVYDDIEQHQGIPVAETITLRFPSTEQSVEISLKRPETNPDYPAAFFSLQPPSGAELVEL